MKKLLSAFLFAFLASTSTLFAMSDASIPTKIPTTWGTSAAGSNITCPIPIPSQISIVGGRASWTDGFPPLTFLPAGAGGVPPFGADFNGAFCQLSQWTRWYNAGAPIGYDSAFSAAVNGYPNGAVIGKSGSAGCYWISTIDNNTSDPDTGGANWTNSCTAGGALAGSYPNPTLATVGVTAGTYAEINSFTVNAGGQVTAVTSGTGPATTTLTPGSGSYPTPAGATRLEIRMVGGGGAGGGTGTGSSGGNGGNGGNSSFNSIVAAGGSGGSTNSSGAGGAGGAPSGNGTGTATLRLQGTGGSAGATSYNAGGGTGEQSSATSVGASSCFGGGGGGPVFENPGNPALVPGAGGSGVDGNVANAIGGSGSGGAGECIEFGINAPTGSYSWTIGASGIAGTGGTSGYAGGRGGPGIAIIKAFFN